MADGAPDTAAVVDRNDDDEYFMRKALEVAERALKIGEVPVGCVIVLDKDHPAVVKKKKNHKNQRKKEEEDDTNSALKERCGVIISHGANQVNATRDATRHSEIVAIDRLLTDGISSDQLRLPPNMPRKGNKDPNNNKDHQSSCLDNKKVPHSVEEAQRNQWEDRWINEPSHPGHWTNSFGWRNNFDHNGSDLDEEEECDNNVLISRELRSKEIFRHCQLFVTCEVSEVILSEAASCAKAIAINRMS